MLPQGNVLLVEDSPDSAMLVNHFLAGSKIAEFRVVQASTLHAAREALSRESFDAILLDLNLPDSRGLETFTRVRETARNAPIVILTGVEDESVATSAIGHGAADYLIKGEIGGEGLARRIRFAIERQRTAVPAEPAVVARLTSILGAKGGAGVTTLAINIASVLAQRGKSVLLVELRPNRGAMAALLNLSPVSTLDSVAELGGANHMEAAVSKLPSGLLLLPAHSGMEARGKWDPDAVNALLQRFSTMAEHVVIDLPSGIPELAQAAISKSGFNILIVERDAVCVQLAARLTSTLAGWAGRPTALGAVLANHMPFLDAAPISAIRTELNCNIFGVLPPGREMLHSYRRHGPIALAQPEAPISKAYQDMAQRLDQDPIQFQAM